MLSKVLIANRGEIALRIMRACKELGLATVAVYSEADRDALHARYADEAYLLGPAPAAESYLSIERLLEVARRCGADALHPGYGFLAESPALARACRDAGLTFVGPTPESMEALAGKTAARAVALRAGVPIVPGTTEPVETAEQVVQLGGEYGYPLAIKAVAGGGGRGLKVVAGPADAPAAFESAGREALAAFGDGRLYVEKYLPDPRHIEIQILADRHGAILALGERECSIQRRHQKLIEEAPSTALTPELRAAMMDSAVSLARAVGYESAGTLEFLFDSGAYYFLEMNTRIQVEHPVTEQVTGIDLVAAQLRIARGEPLPWTQEQLQIRGHAIECRINAEDPAAGFRPASGVLSAYREPAGFGVRVDGGFAEGAAIPQFYDSLLAKLVVWGQSREEAIDRLRRALADFQIEGLPTTLPFHRMALDEPAFRQGQTTVNFIPRYLAERLAALESPAGADPAPAPQEGRQLDVEVNGRRFSVTVFGLQAAPLAPGARQPAGPRQLSAAGRRGREGANVVRSPIQGTVLAARVEPGQPVEAGQVLFIVEAMKMENEIAAPRAGVIAEVHVAVGATVEAGATLASFQE